MSVTISTTINGSVPLPEPNTALPPDADTLPIIDVSSYIPNHNNTPEALQQTSKALHAACATLGIRDWEPNQTNKPLWGENQWPTDEDLPGFRSAYEKWIVQMKELGFVVMEAMADGLGMTGEEWLDLRAKIDDSFWVMRVIGYPPLKDEADAEMVLTNRDYGCLTLLFADPTPRALQVFRHAAKTENLEEAGPGEWINADPIPGCVVCNIGEMWEQIWTNGLYKSTIHRVVHRGTNFRVSTSKSSVLFEPNFDALVEPLPAALRLPEVQGKAEERYQSVVYGEFLYKKVSNNFSLGKGRYD
ncbi:Clavaminate synthase [Rhizoctonia solani]|uniref:Clavaminate synthase n=1 Tax=Rhizoctonia solani TaxID=456999 RepID=A0A8H7I5X3_9AGAM|nr:Clavaminate synthase [Rhizoctonia solani]